MKKVISAIIVVCICAVMVTCAFSAAISDADSETIVIGSGDRTTGTITAVIPSNAEDKVVLDFTEYGGAVYYYICGQYYDCMPGTMVGGTLHIINNSGKTYKVTDAEFIADSVDFWRTLNAATALKGMSVSAAKNMSTAEWYKMVLDHFGGGDPERMKDLGVLNDLFSDKQDTGAPDSRVVLEDSPELIALAQMYLYMNLQISLDYDRCPQPHPNYDVQNSSFSLWQLTNSEFNNMPKDMFPSSIGADYSSRVTLFINWMLGNTYMQTTADFGFTLTLEAVSSDATLASVAGEDIMPSSGIGTIGDPLCASISVPMIKDSISASDLVTSSMSATATMYSDAMFTTNDNPVFGDHVYVKVTAEDGTELYYDVTVVRRSTFDVTLNQTAGGTATADVSSAYEGDVISVSAVPENGYRFDHWTVSPAVTWTSGSENDPTASFLMPGANVEITPHYVLDEPPAPTPTPTPTPTPGHDIGLVEALFDKYVKGTDHRDIAVDLNGNTVSSISCNGYVLVPGQDYKISGQICTISVAYLSTLPLGHSELKFALVSGSGTVKVEVVDTSSSISISIKVSVGESFTLGSGFNATSGWVWDHLYLDADIGNDAVFTAKKEGTTVVTFTAADGSSDSISIEISGESVAQSGGVSHLICYIVMIILAVLCLVLWYRSRSE